MMVYVTDEQETGMPLVNEGIFRELLRYRRLSGDSTLKSRLEKAKPNAMSGKLHKTNLLNGVEKRSEAPFSSAH